MSSHQVGVNVRYKTAIPVTNLETGEMYEGLVMSVKRNVSRSVLNQETGEKEPGPGATQERNTFKVGWDRDEAGGSHPAKRVERTPDSCCSCLQHKYTLLLAFLTLTMLHPSLAVSLLVVAELFIHLYCHKLNKDPATRKKFKKTFLHIFYAEFCALCQSERSMDRISKIQDKRIEKMRKYVKNLQ